MACRVRWQLVATGDYARHQRGHAGRDRTVRGGDLPSCRGRATAERHCDRQEPPAKHGSRSPIASILQSPVAEWPSKTSIWPPLVFGPGAFSMRDPPVRRRRPVFRTTGPRRREVYPASGFPGAVVYSSQVTGSQWCTWRQVFQPGLAEPHLDFGFRQPFRITGVWTVRSVKEDVTKICKQRDTACF